MTLKDSLRVARKGSRIAMDLWRVENSALHLTMGCCLVAMTGKWIHSGLLKVELMVLPTN